VKLVNVRKKITIVTHPQVGISQLSWIPWDAVQTTILVTCISSLNMKVLPSRGSINSPNMWKYYGCLGCMQNVWAPPITVGPNSVWHIRTAINHAAEWCHEFTWLFVLGHCTQLLKHLTVNHLHSLSTYNLKSRSRGPSMTLWSCLDKFTTRHAICKVCCNEFVDILILLDFFELLHSCHRISSVLTVHLHSTNLWL